MPLTRRELLLALGGSATLLATGCTASSPSSTGDIGAKLDGTPPQRYTYGPDAPSQYGDLYLPRTDRRAGTVVVIHGGFWLAEYTSDLEAPLAADLARRGHTVWNVEYRRLGAGGGYPDTLLDVAAAIDHLAVLTGPHPGLDLSRVVVIGHSAGGQLGAWAAGRLRLPAGAPGSAGTGPGPVVSVSAVISQAGLLDLVQADRDDLGGGAVSDFLGGHAALVPDRYDIASPLTRVPLPIPLRCIHGRSDASVPFSQSTAYVAAARDAGGDATVTEVPGGHLDLIDVTSQAWATTVRVLQDLLD